MSDSTEQPQQALSFRKKLLFSLILALLVITVLEGAGQVYLRVARGYAGGEFLQYEFDPYKNIGLQRNWVDARGVAHNAQGFRRSSDVSKEKPEGTYRIFLMGASTAYGLGGLFPHIQTDFEVLDNSQTIDAYLEAILLDALPFDEVEVINSGVPSIGTHHHLINLNQTVLGYDPDMILFLDGFNDHYKYDPAYDQFATYAQNEQASGIMGPPTLRSLVRMNAWWLFRKSAFVHVAVRAAQELKTVLSSGGPPPPVQVEQALADLETVFQENALSMIERNALILQHEGIPAIFMLQPLLIVERENVGRMPPIERELFEFNASWQVNYEEYWRRATPVISRMVEETVTQLGASYLDLTNIYATSDGQIFTDYAHLTPKGNRVLAEHIAPEIIRRTLEQLQAPAR